MIDALVLPEVAWRWEWVPTPDTPAADAEAWLLRTADLLGGWADLPPALLEELPPQERALATGETVGRSAALWLLARAARCPAGTGLAWGAGHLTPDRPRWGPVPVLVDFRVPVAQDASYLMTEVGAAGDEDDARPPVVDYVTTDGGDGVRVMALVRGAAGAVTCRVDAAMRVDVPAYGDVPATSVDVVLSTRTDDLTAAAVLGGGVEELMHRIAAELLPGTDGVPRLVLAGTGEGTA